LIGAVRVLRFDQDDAVCGTHSVVGKARGILQDFDRRNVVRIDAEQGPTRSGLDGQSVDDVQWLQVAVNRGIPPDPYGNAAIGRSGHHPPRDPRSERLFDRIVGGSRPINVLAGYGSARLGNRGGSRGCRLLDGWRSISGGAAGGEAYYKSAGEGARR